MVFVHRTKNFLPPAPVTSWDNIGYLCTVLSSPGDEEGGSGAEARAPLQDKGGLGRGGQGGRDRVPVLGQKLRKGSGTNQQREGTQSLDPSPCPKKISDPFEVCPLLHTSSILKSIPDRRARNCWRISKKKESQPNKKYTPGQYIARSLI